MLDRKCLADCYGIDVATFLLLVISTASTLGQAPAETRNPGQSNTVQVRLDEKLRQAREKYQLPAVWAGRFDHEGPIVHAVAGVRKSGAEELAQLDDPLHLGSCTKAMTAAIIGQLCSEGKLRLDTTLREVFSDVEYVTGSDWGEATVTELLQHTSGAPADMLLTYRSVDARHPDSTFKARRALLEQLCKRSRPRSRAFKYSNVGYIMLGHVVETIEDSDWETLIADRVFKPLGIQSAGFGPVGLPDGSPSGKVLSDRPWGHTESASLASLAKSLFGAENKPLLVAKQIDNSPCLGPAGRVHMDLQDWSRFVLPYAMTSGHEKLNISESVWTSMLTPAKGQRKLHAYAAGWIVFDDPTGKGKRYFHNGSNTTWYSYAIASPIKRQCILVVTNVYTDKARKACDEIARFLDEQ